MYALPWQPVLFRDEHRYMDFDPRLSNAYEYPLYKYAKVPFFLPGTLIIVDLLSEIKSKNMKFGANITSFPNMLAVSILTEQFFVQFICSRVAGFIARTVLSQLC